MRSDEVNEKLKKLKIESANELGMIQYIKENVRIYDFNSNKYQIIVEYLIQKLHNDNRHKDIINIIDNIDYKKLDYLKFGFELAFAFGENNRTKDAKKKISWVKKDARNTFLFRLISVFSVSSVVQFFCGLL
jgi:hypothetical protein